MKIQSFTYVINGVTFCDGSNEAYKKDFDSFADFAYYFHKLLIHYRADQLFVFFDFSRYALVTISSCDLHYHFNFNDILYEKEN